MFWGSQGGGDDSSSSSSLMTLYGQGQGSLVATGMGLGVDPEEFIFDSEQGQQPYGSSVDVDSRVGHAHDRGDHDDRDLSSSTTTTAANIYSSDISADESSSDEYDRSKSSRSSSKQGKAQTEKFIWDEKNRKRRFLTSIHVILAKVKELQNQTGAVVKLKATYESRDYTIADVDELDKQKRNSMTIETNNLPISEEIEGDHRYAATIITQKKSSNSVHDHQYDHESATTTSCGKSKRMRMRRQAWYQEHGSHGHGQVKGPKSVKSERDIKLCELLRVIFTKIAKIEAETEAMVQIEIIYEDRHIFNKQNYQNAEAMLKTPKPTKRKRAKKLHVQKVNTNIVQNPGNRNLLIQFLENQRPIATSSASASVEREREPEPPSISSPRPSEFYSGSPTLPSRSNSPNPSLDLEVNLGLGKPMCRKCKQHFPPGNNNKNKDSSKICWLRCADPLCQYLIHPPCIGFYVRHPADSRRFPKYYCKKHRNWDEL